MTIETWARLLLLFGHLMLCAYALSLLVRTDLRVLRRRVSARTLMRTHRRMALLLLGLWASGLAIIAIDYWGDFARAAGNPKLLAKLTCVLALSANALVLRYYALPRLAAPRELSGVELRVLAAAGAVSSASWLMAAFIGLARPMAKWDIASALGLYAGVLGVAVLVAWWVCPPLLQRRRARHAGTTALEEAAETLDVPRSPAAATAGAAPSNP